MARAGRTGGLGRGLDSLFEDVIMADEVVIDENRQAEKDRSGVIYFGIDEIRPNPGQPRKTFNEEKLKELSESLLQHGMIQPVVVRPVGDGYTIVAGERRWRAAGLAGMEKIPCIVKELTDEEDLLFALIENMQREDLNAIEEASAFREMMDVYGMTQEQVSKAVGRSRPYVSNSIRLLTLPEDIKGMVVEGKLSGAHARTLASVSDAELQRTLAEKASDEGISVRALEKAVSENGKKKAKRSRIKDPVTMELEEKLSEILGGKVSLPASGRRGKVEISFKSASQLETIISRLMELEQQ